MSTITNPSTEKIIKIRTVLIAANLTLKRVFGFYIRVFIGPFKYN